MAITTSKKVAGYLTEFVSKMKAELKEPSNLAGTIFVDMNMEQVEQAIHDEFRNARDSNTHVNFPKIAAICAVSCTQCMRNEKEIEQTISEEMTDSVDEFESA